MRPSAEGRTAESGRECPRALTGDPDPHTHRLMGRSAHGTELGAVWAPGLRRAERGVCFPPRPFSGSRRPWKGFWVMRKMSAAATDSWQGPGTGSSSPSLGFPSCTRAPCLAPPRSPEAHRGACRPTLDAPLSHRGDYQPLIDRWVFPAPGPRGRQ